MGVRRLQTYLEGNCPVACYRVKISALAAEYRDMYGEDPVILVDGSSCFRPLYGKLDWICGGQFKEFADVLASFFQKLKDVGVKLVVFFDGSIHDHKRSVWVDRRYNDMKKAHCTLDKLKDGGMLSCVDKGDFLVPSGISRLMETVSQSYAEVVYRSVKDHTVDIAKYAEKNKCMAILGQNSDYVMFNLSVTKYLSVENLDIPTMSTLVYDRVELAIFLGLDLSDLPVLATLMGNDTFLYYELNKFHWKMLSNVQNRKNTAPLLVKKLAEYIKSLPKGEELVFSLGQISQFVFGNSNRARDLKKSIDRYDVSVTDIEPNKICADDIWSKTLERAHKDCIQLNKPAQLLGLLQHHMYEMSTALEDYRGEMPVSATVLAPFRQRMYGVALRHDPGVTGEGVIVEEFCMAGANSLDSAVRVEAVLPPDDFPGLLEMWEAESDTITPRLAVLSWICSQSLYDACLIGELTSVPQEILAPLCLLSFLYKDVSILEDYEVKVFAAVAVDIQSMEPQELSNIAISNVDVRGVQLASLYTRAINTLIVANSLTGFPISSKLATHENIFDGKLFQSKYSSKDCEQLVEKGSKSNYDLLCKLLLE